MEKSYIKRLVHKGKEYSYYALDSISMEKKWIFIHFPILFVFY